MTIMTTKILDLPDESLLDIVSLVRKRHDEISNRPIWSLSMTCTRLNNICGVYLFKMYHLRIRTNYPDSRNLLTHLDSKDTLEKWDRDAVYARLEHLRRKLPFIQELVIEDNKFGKGSEAEPDVLPEEILPELLSALKNTKITSLRFHTTLGTIPSSLWNWLSTRKLESLYIYGQLSPPRDAQGHLSVNTLDITLFKETAPFLDVGFISRLFFCTLFSFAFFIVSSSIRRICVWIALGIFYPAFTNPATHNSNRS